MSASTPPRGNKWGLEFTSWHRNGAPAISIIVSPPRCRRLLLWRPPLKPIQQAQRFAASRHASCQLRTAGLPSAPIKAASERLEWHDKNEKKFREEPIRAWHVGHPGQGKRIQMRRGDAVEALQLAWHCKLTHFCQHHIVRKQCRSAMETLYAVFNVRIFWSQLNAFARSAIATITSTLRVRGRFI